MKDREDQLKRLTLAQYEQIETQVRKFTRGRLKTYLKEADVEGAAAFNALRDADPDQVTQNMVFHHLATRRGAIDAIVIAAKLAGFEDADATAFAESYDIVDATNLARYLVGFEKRVDVDKGRGKKDDSDPNE